jgi:hypothetical protein
MSEQDNPSTGPISSQQEASEAEAEIEEARANKGLDEATRQRIIEDAQAKLDAWNSSQGSVEAEGDETTESQTPLD